MTSRLISCALAGAQNRNEYMQGRTQGGGLRPPLPPAAPNIPNEIIKRHPVS